mgnify:FL=1
MLDTCAFIDATTDYELLGQDVCALMEDYDNQFCISIDSDHLIISHAITNHIPLISRDRKFCFYKNQGLDLIYYGR